MDVRTLVTISTLFLVTAAGSEPATPGPNVTESSGPAGSCSCPSAAPAATAASSSSRVGLLAVTWASQCTGDVQLVFYPPSNSSAAVCYSSEKNIHSLLGSVCKQKRGCKDPPRWINGGDTLNAYNITESGAQERSSCKTLRVLCPAEVLVDEGGQLQAYKGVTALLCCVLLVLVLIRFTRPTVKALQKRLSNKRQSRWIGPTQSHSVSYHRGKTAVRNNDGEKRLSYPALERLAVSDSREPSSNRNSDYNF